MTHFFDPQVQIVHVPAEPPSLVPSNRYGDYWGAPCTLFVGAAPPVPHTPSMRQRALAESWKPLPSYSAAAVVRELVDYAPTRASLDARN